MATDYGRVWTPDVPVAPGETIREILQERGITQADFATRMGRSEKFISQLVNGKAPITYETALELERVLGVPSSFWNAAEATYRDLLERESRAADATRQAAWAGSFPVNEMQRNKWIAREETPAEQTEALLSFFGVASVEAYDEYWGAPKRLAARMSSAYAPETQAVAAWLRAGEIAAEAIQTRPFDETAFRTALTSLRPVSRLSPDQWHQHMLERCAPTGVAVALVPDLPRTRCHGVSWWVGRTRAVIQLGLRYKTDDQFWFSFFHEAAHLLLDGRGRSGISDLNGDKVVESRADRFAADFLIPPQNLSAFLARHPHPTKSEVITFADDLGIAPGIVAGRLQHDRVIPFDRLNDLKVRLEWS